MRLCDPSWEQVAEFRNRIGAVSGASVEERSQAFMSAMAEQFSTIVLARTFLVVSYQALPAQERAVIAPDPRITATTPILSLIGTRGREPAWNDRTRSVGHRAIPLIDRTVQGAPMIARLLADLEISPIALASGGPIATRLMIGGRNAMFYVPDALNTTDAAGRAIIQPAFVSKYQIESVFGMGGAYLDGTLAIAILFCAERVERTLADRFSSLIGSFKIATMELQSAGALWTST